MPGSYRGLGFLCFYEPPTGATHCIRNLLLLENIGKIKVKEITSLGYCKLVVKMNKAFCCEQEKIFVS